MSLTPKNIAVLVVAIIVARIVDQKFVSKFIG